VPEDWFNVRNGLPVTRVAFRVVAQFRQQIEHNHGETLEQLSAQGGLDWYELWCGLTARSLFPTQPVSVGECRSHVLDVVAGLYKPFERDRGS
jgi:hypothetical protein